MNSLIFHDKHFFEDLKDLITRNEQECKTYTWHRLNLKLYCDGFTLKTVSKLLASWKLSGNNP